MEGNEGYVWEQLLVVSVAVFEQINKLPCREMLSMIEKGFVSTGAQGIVDYTPK